MTISLPRFPSYKNDHEHCEHILNKQTFLIRVLDTRENRLLGSLKVGLVNNKTISDFHGEAVFLNGCPILSISASKNAVPATFADGYGVSGV
jgi:hypothetical protein